MAVWVVTGFFVFKQKTAYEMRISDWSSDVCSADLDDVTPHQLVAPINADMVLVAKVRLSMLLGPARILVFLSVLCRFLLPLKRGLARLYCRIILARVTLTRRGNKCRVKDLSAHRQITLLIERASWRDRERHSS